MAWFDAIEWRRARTAPSSPLSRGIQGVSRGLHGSPGSESLAQPSGERLDRDVGAGNHALTSCERMEGGEPSTRGWRYVRAVGGSRRGYHAVGDAGHAPRIGVEQEANAAAARSSRARRCTDGVAVLDLVEDRVSQRTTGVVFVFCLFLLMSHRYIKDAVPPPPPEVEVISFSSELPALSNISAPLARPPALVLSGAGKAPVGAEPLAVEVVSVHHSSEPFHTINCGTEHRERSRDSMPWLNEAVACTPILRGSHSVSDDKGTVKLHDLRVVHGPPARYTLRFSSSNGMTKEKEMTMQSVVQRLEVDARTVPGATYRVYPGGPLFPEVTVIGANGERLANHRVVALSSQNAHGADVSPGEVWSVHHHLRGQNFALLNGTVSEPSDQDGIARWTNLTLVASASKWLYIMFYCEGVMASWNDPNDAYIASAAGILDPPTFVRPFYVAAANQTVRHIVQIDAAGLPLSCATFATDSADGSSTNRSLDAPWPHVIDMVEGVPLRPNSIARRAPSRLEDTRARAVRVDEIRVRLTDADGRPVRGARVVAVVETAAGFQTPLLAMPDHAGLAAHMSNAERSSFPHLKDLRHSLSDPSDAEGVAAFPNLAWTLAGRADQVAAETGHFSIRETHHRLAFCTGEAETGGRYEGCELSCPMSVRTSVKSLLWNTQPAVLRSARAAGAAPLAGEMRSLLDALADDASLLRSSTPSAWAVGEGNRGVQGQRISAQLLDIDECLEMQSQCLSVCEHAWAPSHHPNAAEPANATERALLRECSTPQPVQWFTDLCLRGRVSRREEILDWSTSRESGWRLCAVPMKMRTAAEVQLDRRADAATDADGLIGLHLAYRSASQRFLSRAPRLGQSGSLRVVLGLEPFGTDSVSSRASGPLQLAVPGDATQQRACVAIVPERSHAPSVWLLDDSTSGPRITPDRRGGGALMHPVVSNRSQQVMVPWLKRDVWSEDVLPVVSRYMDANGAVLFEGVWSELQPRLRNKPAEQGTDGASQRRDAEDYASSWITGGEFAKQTEWGEPGPVHLQAIDEFGRGVPGLSVRLRAIEQEIYPNFPKFVSVSTCAGPDGPASEQCITGSDGSVVMETRPQWTQLGEALRGAGWAEHILNAPTGSVALQYEAFDPADPMDSPPICRSSVFLVRSHSSIARVDWPLHGNDRLTNTAFGQLSSDTNYKEADIGSTSHVVEVDGVRHRVLRLRVVMSDAAGRPLKGAEEATIHELSMIQAPPYLPGGAVSTRSCDTARRMQQVQLASHSRSGSQIGSFGGGPNSVFHLFDDGSSTSDKPASDEAMLDGTWVQQAFRCDCSWTRYFPCESSDSAFSRPHVEAPSREPLADGAGWTRRFGSLFSKRRRLGTSQPNTWGQAIDGFGESIADAMSGGGVRSKHLASDDGSLCYLYCCRSEKLGAEGGSTQGVAGTGTAPSNWASGGESSSPLKAMGSKAMETGQSFARAEASMERYIDSLSVLHEARQSIRKTQKEIDAHVANAPKEVKQRLEEYFVAVTLGGDAAAALSKVQDATNAWKSGKDILHGSWTTGSEQVVDFDAIASWLRSHKKAAPFSSTSVDAETDSACRAYLGAPEAGFPIADGWLPLEEFPLSPTGQIIAYQARTYDYGSAWIGANGEHIRPHHHVTVFDGTKVGQRNSRRRGDGHGGTPDVGETSAKLVITGDGSFPGHYGFVVEVNGVQSVPIFFDHPSELSEISVHTEPEPEAEAESQAGRENVQSPNSTSDLRESTWVVGMGLSRPPCVELRTSTGAPVVGYQVLARAVNNTRQIPLHWSAEAASLGSTKASGFKLFAEQGQSPAFLDVDDDNERNPFINPTGSRFSDPSDDGGVACFPNLNLLDGTDGSCFHLQFYFPSPSAAIMASHFHWGGTDTVSRNSDMPVVAATSHKRLCVINRRRLTIIQHASEVTASGVPLARPLVVRVETPLLQAASTDSFARGAAQDGRHFLLKSSALWGKTLVELVPFRVGLVSVRTCDKHHWAARALRRNQCVFDGPLATTSRDGACSISNRRVFGAELVGNQSECVWNTTSPPCRFVTSGMGTPTFSYEVAFDGGLSWFASPAAFRKTDLQLQAVVACLGEESADVSDPSVARAITLEMTPATISLLTQPPSMIRINQVFKMTVRATISSGAPLQGALVVPEVLDSSGRSMTWQEFLDSEYDTRRATTGDARPRVEVLAASGDNAAYTGTIETDANGVADFSLRFVESPPEALCALRFAAASGATGDGKRATTSLPTLPFTLLNAVQTAQMTLPSPSSRTGLNAVGAPQDLSAFAKGGISDEEFPIDLPLGDLILSANISDLTAGETVSERLKALTRLAQLKFRAFRDSGTKTFETAHESHDKQTHLTLLDRVLHKAVNRSLMILQDRVRDAEATASSFEDRVDEGLHHPFLSFFRNSTIGNITGMHPKSGGTDSLTVFDAIHLPNESELLRIAKTISPAELMTILQNPETYSIDKAMVEWASSANRGMERGRALLFLLKAAISQDSGSLEQLLAILATNSELHQIIEDRVNSSDVGQVFNALTARGERMYSLWKTYSSDASIQHINDWFRLLVSAATRHFSQEGEGGSSVAHVIWPCEPSDSCAVEADTDHAIRISGLKLRVAAPGSFWLQATIGGVASPLADEPILVEQYAPDSDWRRPLLRLVALVAFGGATVGQVEYHSHLRFLAPFSALWTIVLTLLAAYVWPIGGFWNVGTWWMLALGVLFGCHVMQLLRLSTCSFSRMLPQPYYTRRRLAYMSYVRRLVNKRGPFAKDSPITRSQGKPEALKTRSESARTLYHHSEMWRQDLIDARTPWFELRNVWISILTGDDASEAFFFPTRLTSALVVSLFATILMALSILRQLSFVRNVIRQLDAHTIESASGAVRRLCALYSQQSGDELPGEAIEWSYAQIDWLHSQMISLSDAVYLAFLWGSSFASLIYLWAWVVLMLDFRKTVMLARLGIWPSFYGKNVSPTTSFSYIGIQVSNGLFAYIVTTFVVSPFLALAFWPLTRDLALHYIVSNWEAVMIVAGITIFNMGFTKLVLGHIADGQGIRRRYLWMAFDIYMVLSTIIVGIGKGIARFGLVVVVSIVSLPRIDRSPFPPWVELYLQLDTGSKSYQGVIMLTHVTSNPVMNVAIWLMIADASRRRLSPGDCGYDTALHGRRVANRFHLLLFLHRNPGLRKFRNHQLEQVETKSDDASNHCVPTLPRTAPRLAGGLPNHGYTTMRIRTMPPSDRSADKQRKTEKTSLL